MSDVTIPEDVMKSAVAAQNAASDRCKAAKLAAYEYPYASGAAKEVLDEEIARAFLAERERCADLADVLPLTELVRTNDEDPKIIWRVAATTQRDAIAQAIRFSQ